ncbi:MAG TPA: hypothetical protein VMG59_12530 [Phycisphaerae bacterium]|nr:hypothetical protein [Phycisphaerae bacterium]
MDRLLLRANGAWTHRNNPDSQKVQGRTRSAKLSRPACAAHHGWCAAHGTIFSAGWRRHDAAVSPERQ